MDNRLVKKGVLFLFSTLLFACEKQERKVVLNTPQQKIIIQPFSDVSPSELSFLKEKIDAICPMVDVRTPIDLPKSAYYKSRNRYRADSIIRFLKTKADKNSVILGLTNKDISVTKGNIEDYGIMGLAYRSGSACVTSSFRLESKNKKEQWYKIALHELGHTQGLQHCAEKTCLMRDAEGKNHTEEEIDFCKSCKNYLLLKNWNLKRGIN